MQLDKTHVAIRARTMSEVGDLALQVIRRYPQSLGIGLLLGIVPWVLANAALLSWIPLSETIENVFDEETVAERYRYLWLMSLLVFLQAPLAGVLVTYYVGQAVFEQRPPWSRVIAETRKLAPQLFWTLGVKRGPLPMMLLVLFVWGEPFSPGYEVLLLGFFAFLFSLTRMFRPFLPEILLLERCPLRNGGGAHIITAARRSQLLHSPVSGDLVGRFVLGGTMLLLLLVAILSSLVFLSMKFFGSTAWSLWITLVVFPMSLWLTVGFATVMRYLLYLDTRIRLEGWEVELALRAEAQRQYQGDASTNPAIRPRELLVGGER